MKTFRKFIIENYMKLIKLGMCVYWYKQDQFQFVIEIISIINHQKVKQLPVSIIEHMILIIEPLKCWFNLKHIMCGNDNNLKIGKS